jgi:hypothetical protein
MLNNTKPTAFEIDAILDTYEGMLSFCNDGEGADHIIAQIAFWEGEFEKAVAA